MKYKIYKMIYESQVIYVGSTTLKLLSQRKAIGYPKIPKDIWKNSKLELIEETDDKSREDYWINYYRNNGIELYNIKKAVISNKNEYLKEYNELNKEKLKKYQKEYNELNKEKLKKYQKEYNELNKEKRKEYRETNKEKIKKMKKEYRETNKEKIKEYQKEYQKEYKQKNKK